MIQSARVVGNRPNLATLYMHTAKTSKLLRMYTILAGNKLIALRSSENCANAVDAVRILYLLAINCLEIKVSEQIQFTMY